MRERLQGSPAALADLDAMQEEHGLIAPLLAEVDHALADQEASDDCLAETIGELATKLTSHLRHEERDTLPMIGKVLTIGEWSGVLTLIRARGSVTEAMEMFPWLLDRVPPEAVPGLLGSFPPAVQGRYVEWKSRYEARPRWQAAPPDGNETR